jgi:hypothetical protein
MSSTSYPLARIVSPLFLSLSAAIASLPNVGSACDTAMICAWQRTWHGPNALAMPLRGYFIPRVPGRCDRAAYAGGWDWDARAGYVASCAAHGECSNTSGGFPYPPEAGIGFEPVQFERLGKLPNDFGVGPQPSVAAPRAAAPSR